MPSPHLPCSRPCPSTPACAVQPALPTVSTGWMCTLEQDVPGCCIPPMLEQVGSSAPTQHLWGEYAVNIMCHAACRPLPSGAARLTGPAHEDRGLTGLPNSRYRAA
jgi:hypothetical protein